MGYLTFNILIMKNSVPNQRIFRVKFLPASNHKGNRVSITEKRWEKSDRVTVPYAYQFNNAQEVAIDYLTKRGINITSRGELGDFCILTSDSWTSNTNGEFITIK